MRQNRNDIDQIIFDSRKEIEPGPNYNQTLLSKLSDTRSHHSESHIAALSMIFAGFMLLFIHTADLQAHLIEAEYQLKTSINTFTHDVTKGTFLKSF
ncbi:MAG: hypothetical protein H6Q67_1286 [Firmicutes bacterium]|nr:hypothetical protein [Bacillota bacterium]